MHPDSTKIQDNNVVLSPLITKELEETPTKPTKPLGERKKAVRRQELMVLFGNSCVVAFGMSLALPSVSLPQLTSPDDIYQLNTDEVSWFASLNTMTAPIGSLIIGYFMDRFGRKNTMVLNNCVGLLGWILLTTAPYQNSRNVILIQMSLGRFISGLMMGAALAPIGSYSAEISLPRIRGRLVLYTPISIAFGILLMYILGFIIRDQFQLICLISALYQCVSLCCVLPMPESPSWLLQNGFAEKARKALKYFRGLSENDNTTYEEFERELALMKLTSDKSRTDAANESLMQAIKSPEVRKPLIMTIGLFFFQQFSGIMIIIVYAAQIAESAGVHIDPMLVAIFVGIARIITTFFMSTVLERWGRRPAGMLSATGMAICMFLLAANGWWPTIGDFFPLLPVICIVLHIIFSSLGLLTLPVLMISEVFPQRIRGTANGISLFIGLTFGFSAVKLYPSVEMMIGTPNSFFGFGLIILIGLVFIAFVMPETKGRTLLEIENSYRTGRCAINTPKGSHQSRIVVEMAPGFCSSQCEMAKGHEARMLKENEQ